MREGEGGGRAWEGPLDATIVEIEEAATHVAKCRNLPVACGT